MKRRHYKKQRFPKLMPLLAALALITMISQIHTGVGMLRYNKEYAWINVEELDDIRPDKKVRGIVPLGRILTYFDYTDENSVDRRQLLVMTPQKKLLIMLADSESSADEFYYMDKVPEEGYEMLDYKGTVRKVSDDLRSRVEKFLTPELQEKYGVTPADMMKVCIQTIDDSDPYETKEIVFTFAGAFLMLPLMWLLLRKTVNNLIYNYQLKRGLIEPDLAVRREDLSIEHEGVYRDNEKNDGGFYVNNDYLSELSLQEGQEYHFDPSSQPEVLPQDDAADAPADHSGAKPADAEYYRSGLNEEGQFYVHQNKEASVRDNENYRKRY